jgi:hypothetical protein
VLRLCRDLIALRSAEFRGRIASYQELPAPPGVWAFRVGRLHVTANFSDQPAAVAPVAAGPVLASSTDGAFDGGTVAPWSGVIIGPAR